jgi:Zn-dependent M28 family amino/carboxypeptidase
MIEGENPDEIVVVGGHMDHMGMSGGRVWNGADDNASGTVGVMTIARAFAATGVKPKRTVVFCAWTGEEKGLLGSEYFTKFPPVGSIDQVKFYLNYDMISRDAQNDTARVNVGVTYNKDYPYLEELSRKNTEEYGLKMNYSYRAQENPTGGSDYTAFSENKIPIIAVMAAMHPEYHTTADQVELINWDKMLDIIKLGFLNVWEIANSDFNK